LFRAADKTEAKWILHFVQNDKPRAISATVLID